MKKLTNRLNKSRDLWVMVVVFAAGGLAIGLTETAWNNFYATYGITATMRGMLEIPRETPGLLLVFITGFLLATGIYRTGAIARIIHAVGLLGVAYLAPTFPYMAGWTVFIALGTHIYMPIEPALAMSLAEEGQEGTRIGQMRGAATLATVIGTLVIIFGFSSNSIGYKGLFVTSSVALLIAAGLLLTFKNPQPKQKKRFHLVVRKEYWLFYVLSLLSGVRKQVNLFLIPWLLIHVWHQPLQVFAILTLITAIINIGLHPLLGKLIDRFGERRVSMGGALVTTVVCLCYALITKEVFGTTTLIILLALKVVEMLSLSTGSARHVYAKRIAVHPDDVTPTLSLGVSLDHLTAVPFPLLIGVVWDKIGYNWVFIGAAAVTLLYYGLCFFMPKPKKADATA